MIFCHRLDIVTEKFSDLARTRTSAPNRLADHQSSVLDHSSTTTTKNCRADSGLRDGKHTLASYESTLVHLFFFEFL